MDVDRSPGDGYRARGREIHVHLRTGVAMREWGRGWAVRLMGIWYACPEVTASAWGVQNVSGQDHEAADEGWRSCEKRRRTLEDLGVAPGGWSGVRVPLTIRMVSALWELLARSH